MAGRAPAPTRLIALETAVAALAAALTCAWFASRSTAAVALLAAALVAALAARARPGHPPRRPRPRVETLVCLALAVAYRAPALVHPWGWVNRDGAYGAFVAIHLLDGGRPAPVFTEGANYQGTLKGHLAALLALLTGVRDFSWLMVVSSLLLYLVFVAATMALARRLAGPPAAAFAGLYLALGPRFLTVFSLNCVGQYMDVLALGSLALVLAARVLDDGRAGREARLAYAGIGALLGAAFWQQPVALAYAGAVAGALALRARTWRDPWALLVPAGALLGALPVLVWNAQNDWASVDILGRDPGELRAQADALPHLVRRTATISFPILAGLSPGHPWADVPAVRAAAVALIPLALAAYAAVRGRPAWRALREGRSGADLLAPLLMAACLALFWAIASGRVYWRPRYLLPVAGATAVHLGVALAWSWRRARAPGTVVIAGLLALHVAGTLPRLRDGGRIAEQYARLVRSLREKGIRTGYADFSISAPVTMFTAEQIVLSPGLGPTPAYESDRHRRLVEAAGPDAYVLRPEDDADAFARTLRGLGVSFRLDRDPVPVFHAFSRRVPLQQVIGAGTAPAHDADE
ncbi:MAG TPA: glycosyltransferase family 39 protein [Vicinamibacteria bacterium]